MQLEPITWSDIDAYFKRMRLNPERWEIRALRELDHAFLKSRMEEATSKAGGAKALTGRMRAIREKQAASLEGRPLKR